TTQPRNGIDLTAEYGSGLVLFPFFLCFAHTQYRYEFGCLGDSELLRDECVTFPINTATFRMPDNHVPTTGIRQHFRADLAGKCTFSGLVAYVLGTESHPTATQCLPYDMQVNVDRADAGINGIAHLDRIDDFPRKGLRVLQVAVHLPLGGDKWLSTHASSFV